MRKGISFVVALSVAMVLFSACSKVTPTEPEVSQGPSLIKASAVKMNSIWNNETHNVYITYTGDPVLTINNIYVFDKATKKTLVRAATTSAYRSGYPTPPVTLESLTSTDKPYSKLKLGFNTNGHLVYAVEDFYGQGQFCHHISSGIADGSILVTDYK